MIKMFSAYTKEIDEIEDAIGDILEQIDLSRLEKNSVGLVYCHGEFVESGVVRALSDRLPFDVIGMTAASVACKDFYGLYGLCLSVLTSDTVEFTTAFTDPLTPENYAEKISDAYESVRSGRPADPALIIPYLPYMDMLSGAQLVHSFDEICGGIPLYGGVCYGVNMGNEKSATLLNGEARGDALAMLLVYGDVKPMFKAVSLPDRHIRGDRAIITDSEGCFLRKVNDTPILKYLEELGYSVQKGAPLMVYYPGSAKPVALAIYTAMEDGSVLCGGEVPVGASVAIGDINRDIVLETANECIQELLNAECIQGAILFPCAVRYFVLYPDQDAEMKLTSEALHGKLPYVMGYSGGEICPVPSEDGSMRNRFHNLTYCACIL